MVQSTPSKLNRRSFLKNLSASAAGLVLVKPASAFGAEANSNLELGIIGCGGRGPWIGQLFEEHTKTKVVALHDYFRDRVQQAAERLAVPPSRCYVGLEGYRELLGSGVDAVAVESPPYFHPEQTAAAIDAGKHVFLAKPVAVDVPGCRVIIEAAQKAKGRLSLLVDFQTRNDELFRGAAQGVHEGLIGEPVCGQAFYHTGRLGIRMQPGTEVARLRNWVFDKALSGDIIVEQNVHVLDVANWYLQGHPIEAYGTGGRRVRTDVGDAWDHFIVTFVYPKQVLMDFSSTQFTQGFDDICIRVFGSAGTVESHYGGEVTIRNRQGGWKGGATSQIYRQGAVNNIKDFHAGILSGAPLNTGEEGALSTLTSILGRTAAYERRLVTWDEMMAANVKLDPQLNLPPDGPESTA